MRPGDRQVEKERLAGPFLTLHEIDAPIHQLPVDLAPHLGRVRFHCLKRLAPIGLDDLGSLVQGNLKRLGLPALGNHQERVPGIARRDTVELVEALILRQAVGLVAEVPLTEHRGGITSVTQHLGHRDLHRRERDGTPRHGDQR